MSGGSYNYMFGRVEDEYVGRMYDPILNEMMKDLVVLLKDLEWWQSGDNAEEYYRKTVKKFKEKYFKNISETTKEIILKEVDKVLIEAGIKEE